MNNDPFKYGPGEGAWLKEQIVAFWDRHEDDEFECTDSFRLARKGDASEEQEYDETISCCGKMDLEFGPSPEGHTYFYGFNYGH